MLAKHTLRSALSGLAAALATLGAGAALADAAHPYPDRAPIEQYRMSQADEVALARSAAPPSISDKAEVLVLGARGYETAADGTNGFVCIVERAWASGFDDAGFWNPKIRGPICFNPASVRSVLPTYLQRTRWVLAGDNRAQLIDKTKAAIAAGEVRPPEAGAMCYMMAKGGYLGDDAGGGGHWHPHLMFFVPHDAAGKGAWGANQHGSPVMGGDNTDIDPAVVYFVVVSNWSDGTPGPMMGM
jgi:hypothetical protein